MRKALIVLLVMANWSVAASAQQPILREIRLSDGRVLTLGQPIGAADAICIQSGANCTLKAGTYDGAESIIARVSPTQTVTRIVFGYGVVDAARMAQMSASYEKRLGRPSSCTGESRSSNQCSWRDATTEFVLAFARTSQGMQAFATLIDLAD
jgi:hypothetical protein